MANFYVTNNKFPAVPQLFVVSLHKIVGPSAPEINSNFYPTYAVAEPTWKVLVYTSGFDIDGKSVSPIKADVLGSEETVNSFIEGAVAFLCGQVDWSQQGAYSPEIDTRAPIVVEQFPEVSQTEVPITSTIAIRVKDFLPATGIDASTVQMSVDGFSVTPNVAGNKFDYTFTYKPLPVYE